MAQNAKAIPEGFRTVTPHLVVRGAGDAIEFYKKAFGAEEIMRMPGPDGRSVMHAEIKIGDSMVMLCDESPHMQGSASPQTYGGTTAFRPALRRGRREGLATRGGCRRGAEDARNGHFLGRPLRPSCRTRLATSGRSPRT